MGGPHDPHRRSHSRHGGSHAPDPNTRIVSPSEGILLLPTDDVARSLAPARLLPVLARLIQNTKVAINGHNLYRLLQNIAKQPILRDYILRLFAAMLVEDQPTVQHILRELNTGQSVNKGEPGPQGEALNMGGLDLAGVMEEVLEEEDDEEEDEEVETARSTVARAMGPCLVRRETRSHPHLHRNNDDEGGKLSGGEDPASAPSLSRNSLPQKAASRLVALLFHLVTSNTSSTYDMLRPRETLGGR